MATKTTAKPKILIVDDEAAILHALGLYLQHEGYSTEAIAKFDHYLANMDESKLPDVVVLDILLNQEDGLKIAREIKEDPNTSHIPIILISALPNVDKLAKDVDADAYLAKPFDVKKLNDTVQKVLKPTRA